MSQQHAPGAPDVTILGGGLAGLTLAIQLRNRFPRLDVRVLERRKHPVPPGEDVARHEGGLERGWVLLSLVVEGQQ